METRSSQFFIRKIENIHLKLDSLQTLDEGELSQPSFSGTPFTVFQPILTDDIEKLVMKAPNKTCDNDPVPTQVVKACINDLLPSISNTVNSSLSSAIVLGIWKEALVKPKLKKPNLDIIKKNYRRVSNLTFLSKITEKVVAQQILQHISSNNLFPEFQSAYRSFHSTETALMRVCNDILLDMNKQHVVLLVFLDLSAAFDTVDHDVLLNRLEHRFGI